MNLCGESAGTDLAQGRLYTSAIKAVDSCDKCKQSVFALVLQPAALKQLQPTLIHVANDNEHIRGMFDTKNRVCFFVNAADV